MVLSSVFRHMEYQPDASIPLWFKITTVLSSVLRNSMEHCPSDEITNSCIQYTTSMLLCPIFRHIQLLMLML